LERWRPAPLAVDVVGYTHLLGVDETVVLRDLTELREDILEPESQSIECS
jgi:hypothetical protein